MKIAIITGGNTGEREISIKSAATITSLIDFAETKTFTFPEEKNDFIRSANDFDLAIPMIHGIGGEDGSLQKLFKELNVPFIFSDIETHTVGIDKIKSKEIAQTLGIISPIEIDNFPLFAKPRFGGSSVASKICLEKSDLDKLLAENPEIEFIKEELVKGREFTVGIINDGKVTIPMPVLEIVPSGKFFDFENKYDTNKLANEICPANIDSSLSNKLQNQSLLIHNHLKAKDVSRCDFIVTPDNRIYFLEINTIPGMTNTSLLPKMISAAGLSFKEILKNWCSNKLPIKN